MARVPRLEQQEERIMAMAAVIHQKGAPDNFVWEEIKLGSPERGQVRFATRPSA
jgi:hypothetical protein